MVSNALRNITIDVYKMALSKIRHSAILTLQFALIINIRKKNKQKNNIITISHNNFTIEKFELSK